MKWLKRIGIALVVLLVVFVGVPFGVGSLMSRDHVGSGSVTVRAPIHDVWKTVSDYEAMPSWWSERSKIERVSGDGATAVFREASGDMALTYAFATFEPPRRLVVDLKDDDGYFGGSWTYELEPQGEQTRVTITERGWAGPGFFRFMLAVFGADKTLRGCLDALRAKHGG